MYKHTIVETHNMSYRYYKGFKQRKWLSKSVMLPQLAIIPFNRMYAISY